MIMIMFIFKIIYQIFWWYLNRFNSTILSRGYYLVSKTLVGWGKGPFYVIGHLSPPPPPHAKTSKCIFRQKLLRTFFMKHNAAYNYEQKRSNNPQSIARGYVKEAFKQIWPTCSSPHRKHFYWKMENFIFMLEVKTLSQ